MNTQTRVPGSSSKEAPTRRKGPKSQGAGESDCEVAIDAKRFDPNDPPIIKDRMFLSRGARDSLGPADNAFQSASNDSALNHRCLDRSETI